MSSHPETLHAAAAEEAPPLLSPAEPAAEAVAEEDNVKGDTSKLSTPLRRKKSASMFAASSTSSSASSSDSEVIDGPLMGVHRARPPAATTAPPRASAGLPTAGGGASADPQSVRSGGGFRVTNTSTNARTGLQSSKYSSPAGSPDPSSSSSGGARSGTSAAVGSIGRSSRLLYDDAEPASQGLSPAGSSRHADPSASPLGAGSQQQLVSHGLVEFCSRPISAVEGVVFKGSSDFTVTGKQSTKMTIRGRPHHMTTVLARPNSLPAVGPASVGGGGGSNAGAGDAFAERPSGGKLTNDSVFFGTFATSDNSSIALHPAGGSGGNATDGSSSAGVFSNSSVFGGPMSNASVANATAAAAAAGAGGGMGATMTTTTSSTTLTRHHIVMGFGDEYEGEVTRVGNDWIPHGEGILQSVLGQHCFVGTFKMKRREGRGKLATPRFVLWGEWRENRPDSTHSARIDNCLTGERYRGNYRVITDAALLNDLAKAAAKKNANPADQVSKFSQWLQCSTVEYCKYGELVSPNGTRYFGEWVKGQQTGFGVQIFPNGDRYVGHFVKGLYHGNGAYFTYKRPHVCEPCERREAAFESNEAALDASQAESLLLRAGKLLPGGRSRYGDRGGAGLVRSVTCRHRTLAEVNDVLTSGAFAHHHHSPTGHGHGNEILYTYANTGAGAGGSLDRGYPNCGLAEKLTAMGADGTVYDGIWEKGCFKGEGTHITLPDRTRITADWQSVTKGARGHIFGPSLEEKTRRWQEHFHWEPLLCARPQERRDAEYEALASVRQQLRFCADKRSFDALIASEVVKKCRSIVSAIKMFRRCFFASFGTCGATDCVGAGGGAAFSGGSGGAAGPITVASPAGQTMASPTGGVASPASPTGGAPSASAGPQTTTTTAAPTDASRAALGWCKAHLSDVGGCIHLGKGRRITSTDVSAGLTDIFSFVSSVQRFVEEMLEDDVEYAEAEDERYFENKARLAELSTEGNFPNPFAAAITRTASTLRGSERGVDGGNSLPTSAQNHSTSSSGDAATGGSNTKAAAASAASAAPPPIVIRSMADRLFESASEAFQEYEGVALIRREVFDAVMREVHDIVHNLYAHAYASENRAVHVALQRIAGISLDDLGVSFGRHAADERLFDPYAEATRALESLSRYKSVSGKLKCLRQWSQAIDTSTRLAQVRQLEEQLAHARQQSTMLLEGGGGGANNASASSAAGGGDGGASASAASPTTGGGTSATAGASITKVKAIESGSADDLLPIHQYVLLNARVPNLLVEVKLLLDVTADPHLIDVTSQDSFCITTLQACVSSIPQMCLAVRDEAAVVTPAAMFARRAEEALLSAATLPSDLVEYGYLRDALAVTLGVLPEFPPLTLPLRMEGPAQFPLETFDYCRAWVPSVLNGLFAGLTNSQAAFEWRQWQEDYKREEGRRKAGCAAGSAAAGAIPQPPGVFVPFAAMEAAGASGGSCLARGDGSTGVTGVSLLETIFGPFAFILASGNGGPATPARGRSRAPNNNGSDTSSAPPSRSASLMSGGAWQCPHGEGCATCGAIDADAAPACDDGSVASSIRIAMLRDALFTQRKAGLDDTARNAEELIRIAKDPSLWPSPMSTVVPQSSSGGSGGHAIIGDSAPTAATNANTNGNGFLLVSGGGEEPSCASTLGGGSSDRNSSLASRTPPTLRPRSGGAAAAAGGQGQGLLLAPPPVRESEVALAIRSLAPKPHIMSELYVEDGDLLAYQIKNALFSGRLGGGGGPADGSSPTPSLGRADTLLVWYVSLTREERRVLRFAKKLLIAARCLAAVNVHLCADVGALPPVPPMFRRTVEDKADAAAAAGGGAALARTTSTVGVGLGLAASLSTTPSANGEVSPSQLRFMSVLELFPAKTARIEELKALLACGARLAGLVSKCYSEAEAAVASHAATISIEQGGVTKESGEEAAAAGAASGLVDSDDGESEDASSEWSLDFESSSDNEGSDNGTDAFPPSSNKHQQPISPPFTVAERFAECLGRHFTLKMSVVHDASVYAEAAKALLRCDPREKS